MEHAQRNGVEPPRDESPGNAGLRAMRAAMRDLEAGRAR